MMLQTINGVTNYAPRSWAPDDDKKLVVCTGKNATMHQMVKALRRSEHSIARRCVALKINLDYLNTKES